jgi:hypothetical protein
MPPIDNFDVMKAMSAANGRIYLAPIGNILTVKKVKAGTQIAIGIGGDFIGAIARGELVGGLILADKVQFNNTKRELEGAAPAHGLCDKHAPTSSRVLTRCWGCSREEETALVEACRRVVALTAAHPLLAAEMDIPLVKAAIAKAERPHGEFASHSDVEVGGEG